jgi:hypothetical protein
VHALDAGDGAEPTGDSGVDARLDATADAGTDAASDARVDDAAADAGCEGLAPYCFVACGGDHFHDDPAVCVNGAWDCLEGYLPADCPAGTCFGLPLPGEVCDDGAWICRPEDTDTFDFCPAFACVACDGFSGAMEQQGCRCECTTSGVHCTML